MKINRKTTLIIHFILDELIPPFLRDKKWFMWLPFKLLFKNKSEIFFNFKNDARSMSHEQFCSVYEQTASVHLQRETDLNIGCIKEIEKDIQGNSVLEVGCGRGYLAGLLSKRYNVTACDMKISNNLLSEFPRVTFREDNIENLSFDDKKFDTVVCTHTLEHVQNIYLAIKELRRVTKKKLIIVVPKQRPYMYTFDLHLHFFPYKHILLSYLGNDIEYTRHHLVEIEGDWYYQEEYFC